MSVYIPGEAKREAQREEERRVASWKPVADTATNAKAMLAEHGIADADQLAAYQAWLANETLQKVERTRQNVFFLAVVVAILVAKSLLFGA